ncbi:MAG: chitobiase/beta-hexosaminidase C-terminal domain-containing protein [Bacteroidetes bacterium]|nr:chitobiase/beta-hexosaminidase C-terminal domain-containing protein [Bacteroidota bacterium]
MKKQLCVFLFLLFLPVLLRATITLPSILSSNMVLQQNSEVRIWGWATPNEIVRVRCSWLSYVDVTEPDASGRWMVSVVTKAAGGPYTITIFGENKIILSNILFGEVWVCSGQSNMEYTINMLGGWKYFSEIQKEVVKTDYSEIRFCQVMKATADKPSDTCTVAWASADVRTIEDFSATAFFYGRELYRKLHVPIGLISANWGGTPAEAWTEFGYLEQDPELSYFLQAPNGEHRDPGKPSMLFNAMIHPILNFAIKGVIWYQGEANIHEADLYRRLFTNLIHNWRDAWGLGDFPFYYVQIAPYDYREPYNAAAFLRNAQLQCLAEKNTGMVVTGDIGSLKDIHPKNKQEVGRRLALWALAKTYKTENEECSGPLYSGIKKEGKTLRIFFSHAGTGLTYHGPKLTGFSLCGPDNQFYTADAVIEDSTVIVSSQQVDQPKNVRYAFSDTDTAVLYNKAGLPASSFRTDSLPFFMRKVRININADTMPGNAFVSMECADNRTDVHYTLDGSDPLFSSAQFQGSFRIDSSVVIKARAFKGQTASPVIAQVQFVKHSGVGKKLTFFQPYSPHYAGGKNVLLDGIRGTSDFRDNHWQGFQGVDFDATVDLGEHADAGSVSINFLQDQGSWIFLPVKVEFSVSSDGIYFRKINSQNTSESPKTEGALIKEYSCSLTSFKSVKGASAASETGPIRFIRINAKNMGVCPKWHPGKGQPAWIFADEIVIR